MNEAIQTNHAYWDEVVPIHVASDFYDVASFKAGRSTLQPVERREVGDVAGKSLLHLQCHFGMDTMSWARAGATVTGIDFSANAIETARNLSAELNIPARFIKTDVYKLGDVLEGQFDIVFATYGVLCWLPDFAEWARIAASYVKPGGFFYLAEHHPLSGALDDKATATDLRITLPYLRAEQRWDEDGTYADRSAHLENTKTVEYTHPIGEIVTGIIDAGLRLEFLHEYPFCGWPRLPSMTKGDDGYYRLPEGDVQVPFLFSLRAWKD